MSSNLTKAKALLKEELTCVICSDTSVVSSRERGVKPLLQWLTKGLDGENLAAADKVVGRAAAYLYVLLGVKEVYAPVMSETAIAVFTSHQIAASYDVKTETIINRAGTGMCPMEQATEDCKTPKEALTAIQKKVKELAMNN